LSNDSDTSRMESTTTIHSSESVPLTVPDRYQPYHAAIARQRMVKRIEPL
jgi:hypothetical protein